jgi:hypothetical protein
MVYLADNELTPEFKIFCRSFHQDCFSIGVSLGQIIDGAIAQLNDAQKIALKAFLGSALGGSDQELIQLWEASPADYFIPNPSHVRELFTETIKQL